MNKSEDKIEKIARKIVGYKNEVIKQDYLNFLLVNVKTIYVNCHNNFTASKKNKNLIEEKNLIEIEYNKIVSNKNIENWFNETKHLSPFYPREFIKKLLKSCTIINRIPRGDDEDKNNYLNYNLNKTDNIKKFFLDRILINDENNGLLFKINELKNDEKSNNLPVDLYNSILIRKKDNKKVRVYIKFYIDNDNAFFDLEMNLISFHDDFNQKGIK